MQLNIFEKIHHNEYINFQTFQLSSEPKTIRFSWFTADSETFGHSKKCNNSLYEVDRYLSTGWYWNDVCVCSVNFTNESNFPDYSDAIKIDEPKIMKISLEPQLSDTKYNRSSISLFFSLSFNFSFFLFFCNLI